MSSPKAVQIKPIPFPYEEFEKLVNRVVDVRYPPSRDWDEATIARHRRHLVLAYQLRPDLLVEDALEILNNPFNEFKQFSPLG